ncbi:BMP family protein [bacterium]|nr:BMP family protein [bacterium]
MIRPSPRVATLAVLLALGIAAGCTKAGEGGKKDGAFRVALLTPGPVSDGGWNASAYEGLLRIAKELGAETSNVQTTSPAEFEQTFRDYARQGYDLVIGHGFEYQDAALKVGAQYPETAFLVSSGGVSAKNVASLEFELDEATYLAGLVAASMSKTGKAGCVGGIQLPVIKTTFDGFEAGARSVRPDFKVSTVYVGSFEDVAGAKAATDALIAQGADFILHNADAAGIGVFQSAKAGGALAFGTNKDQAPVAPDTVLASAVIDMPKAFVQVAREVKEKTFAGRVVKEGFATGCVDFTWNPALLSRVPADLRAKVDDARAKIASGALKVHP